MNLLHGDHMADLRREGRIVATVLASQDIGTPRTARVKG